MKYLVFLSIVFYSFSAAAINCAESPKCEELGFSTAEDKNCLPNGYIYCPFDKDYKKCVNFNCEALGFTTSNKTEWCKTIVKCPNDDTYTLCSEKK